MGVTANRFTFIENGELGSFQPLVYFRELGLFIDLNAEVIDAIFRDARGDGEVDPWVLQHPLGVIVLANTGFDTEQG